MTDQQDTALLPVAEVDRHSLSYPEQMADAQAQCVPCKLCGGKAVIEDAGPGYGYYIACENSTTFNSSNGCLNDQRRVGGWAYNVSDWWNRLQAPAEADAPARGPFRVSCPYCGPLGPSEEHNLTCPRYPTSKLTSAEAGEEVERVADSGFSAENLQHAEWVWANLPTARKWASLSTAEKALVVHTLGRPAITALRANAPEAQAGERS